MPAENWNYWKFQGEFWIDEIGYYQYTLKRGLPGEARGVARAERGEGATMALQRRSRRLPGGGKRGPASGLSILVGARVASARFFRHAE